MQKLLRKVAILGTGFVGSSTAYSLINQGICDELMLIDIKQEKALGESLDLIHCMDFLPSRTNVYSGTVQDTTDMDIIIVSAGPPPKENQTRLDTLETGVKIMNDTIPKIMAAGFNGVFLIATNPVDIITYHIWKLSGLPRHQVIGTGTSIDSSRLKTYLAQLLEVDVRSIQAYTMGEHGDSQFAAWSHCTVGGKPLIQIINESPDKYASLDLDHLVEKVKRVGFEILKRKGTTYYGIGNALAFFAAQIFNDSQRIIATSCILDGEYKEANIATGVPAVIGRNGIQQIVELRLTDKEQQMFDHSNNVLRDYMRRIGYSAIT
ncbi:L-lactate dehydrogenase [Virgibacillus pantothenticus]|uniref:L-lactate dehydrogenase n=1 Tax=Virgibacillus pantothenticus TaxID=1473 RepID=UPI000986B4BF|nr:L-lactate dehydrogenase [Virgibacillus pantothenticus]